MKSDCDAGCESQIVADHPLPNYSDGRDTWQRLEEGKKKNYLEISALLKRIWVLMQIL
jgi:hypothetical protein